MPKENKKSMIWVLYALGAALAWGFYGDMLHRGQVALANPMKALLCVGMAYFLIGVLAPAGMLCRKGRWAALTGRAQPGPRSAALWAQSERCSSFLLSKQ